MFELSRYFPVLKLLCDPDNAGSLICCSHGKDRTGIVTALVLSVCGRSREEICEDYVKSQVGT